VRGRDAPDARVSRESYRRARAGICRSVLLAAGGLAMGHRQSSPARPYVRFERAAERDRRRLTRISPRRTAAVRPPQRSARVAGDTVLRNGCVLAVWRRRVLPVVAVLAHTRGFIKPQPARSGRQPLLPPS